MTVVVTGASGFVGINLINNLSNDGYEVKALDNIPIYNEKGKVKWSKCDVTKKEEILSFLDKDVETVYHLAGIVGVKNYLSNPLSVIDVNFESTRYIVESAIKFGFTTVFASTSEIYGKNPSVPWSEDDDRVLGSTNKSRWIYSTSKALSEHLLFAEAETHGIRNIIVRFFNLYGRYQKPINVIPKMITSLILNKKLTVYDFGSQTRCFTYIDDAIDAILKLVKANYITNDSFNIGSNVETNINELANDIIDLFNDKTLEIEHIDTSKTLGENYEDIGRRVPDVSKIYEKVRWKSTTELTSGLRNTIQWYKSNIEWWKPYH